MVKVIEKLIESDGTKEKRRHSGVFNLTVIMQLPTIGGFSDNFWKFPRFSSTF